MAKVLQIIDKRGYGGIQQVAEQLRLLIKNHDVTIYEYLPQYSNSKLNKWIWIIFRLLREVNRGYDMILVHSPIIVAFAPIFKLLGKKVCFCLHGPHQMFPSGPNDIVGFLRWLSLLFVDKIVLVSSAQGKYISSGVRIKSKVIQNIPKIGFDNIFPNQLAAFKTEHRFYFHVARICYQKNQLFSLLVHYQLKKIDHMARLVIIGSGSDEDEGLLRAEAKKLNLTIFRGWTNDLNFLSKIDVIILEPIKAMTDILEIGNLLIFPSRFEGYPLSIVEGLLLGFKIFASDCDTGPKDILEALTNELNEYKPLKLFPPIFDLDHANIWAQDIALSLNGSHTIKDSDTKILIEIFFDQEKFIRDWTGVLSV